MKTHRRHTNLVKEVKKEGKQPKTKPQINQCSRGMRMELNFFDKNLSLSIGI